MDAFTDEISKIAVPSVKSGAIFQHNIYNLTIVPIIKSLDGYYGIGNIEFWPQRYSQNNKKEVPEASSSRYDWGDERSSGNAGYGSMQVHGASLKSTVFAFNH